MLITELSSCCLDKLNVKIFSVFRLLSITNNVVLVLVQQTIPISCNITECSQTREQHVKVNIFEGQLTCVGVVRGTLKFVMKFGFILDGMFLTNVSENGFKK